VYIIIQVKKCNLFVDLRCNLFYTTEDFKAYALTSSNVVATNILNISTAQGAVLHHLFSLWRKEIRYLLRIFDAKWCKPP
jgi:hypothetical protein